MSALTCCETLRSAGHGARGVGVAHRAGLPPVAPRRRGMGLWLLLAVCALSGCASVNFDDALAQTNTQHAAFTQGNLELAQTDAQRSTRETAAAQLLSQPLSQAGAVQLAMVNSPALQALLAQNWSDAADAAQSGRIFNPTFSFERTTVLDEVEIGRRLSFGLMDLLTLPLRHSNAQRGLERARLQLASDVVDSVTQVRQAWVRAVSAQQTLVYAKQVRDAAQASAELARRMQAAGNFTRLDRMRQQLFYADATTQFAVAQNNTQVQREALVRLLGLTDAQALQLRLPERLPDVPTQPRSPEDIGKAASAERIDVKLAKAGLERAASLQGLEQINSFTDIELGLRRDTQFDNGNGTSTSVQGYEVSFTLPLFDWGGVRREAMNAHTLAAANRLEATVRNAASSLREGYGAYRTAYDVAVHYRDEVVPLRKAISEENVLRYNGMLIGVFDLLADTRDQIASVMAAIAADQQFWLADAALQATLTGRPTAVAAGLAPAGASGASPAAH